MKGSRISDQLRSLHGSEVLKIATVVWLFSVSSVIMSFRPLSAKGESVRVNDRRRGCISRSRNETCVTHGLPKSKMLFKVVEAENGCRLPQ